SEGIRAAIPGQPGAFAAAVLTGDRSGLEAGPVEDMRDANIAHLLAISGLHMGLLTGVVYGGLRLALALVPYLALRYPIRKWAAAGALCAAAFYLALSGGNVATERAFIQVAVMLCAVMLDRRAITLRSVAIAALIVLAHRPETLFSPGFQMSFAATAALVAVFNGLRGAEWLRARPGWQKWLFALMMSSIVAGAATAPYAAAHFNRVSVYGLAANLLTVPVMGSLIIPAAVVAAILWPLGLSWLAFAVMEPGLIWTLEVARRVSDLPGAVDFVPNPPPGTLGLVSAGGVLLILWRGRGRWTGLAPLALAGALWTGGERPAVLVSDTGGLVGVMTEEGRALSRPRGDGFVAGIWLENDGDRATQEEAAARPGWVPDGAGMSIETGDLRIWHGAGRRALADAARACADHDLLVLSEPLEGAEPVPEGARPGSRVALAPEGAAPTVPLSHPAAQPPGPARPASPAMAASAAPVAGCMILDPVHLAGTGAVAIAAGGGRFTIRTARETQGTRLWTPDP
ncbi:ComEC/Rec2 family competence protein, partial [Roseicyclus sp.]|uniref:ComEC/Rec2 family competence protein n=1 Tax=Roseicyclus sp. TaxID=1914329 RepID=UPI003FA15E41